MPWVRACPVQRPVAAEHRTRFSGSPLVFIGDTTHINCVRSIVTRESPSLSVQWQDITLPDRTLPPHRRLQEERNDYREMFPSGCSLECKGNSLRLRHGHFCRCCKAADVPFRGPDACGTYFAWRSGRAGGPITHAPPMARYFARLEDASSSPHATCGPRPTDHGVPGPSISRK